MGVVDLEVHMKGVSVAQFGVTHGAPPKLVIRLARMGPNAPKGVTQPWAWAILQEIPGQLDKPIIGGQADTQTEAAARAYEELKRQELRFHIEPKKPPEGRSHGKR